jgi:hypothetical protein
MQRTASMFAAVPTAHGFTAFALLRLTDGDYGGWIVIQVGSIREDLL